MAKIAGTGGVLLIPVDFSDYSIPAVKAGFEFAVRLDMHPLIMHTFTAPVAQTQMAFPDSFPDSFSDEFQDAAVGMEIRTQTEKRMEVFEDNIKKLQNEGELSDIRFSTQVSQGLPEEVISEYCRVSPPGLIVMATRGKRRREADMIGSVTAEVLSILAEYRCSQCLRTYPLSEWKTSPVSYSSAIWIGKTFIPSIHLCLCSTARKSM